MPWRHQISRVRRAGNHEPHIQHRETTRGIAIAARICAAQPAEVLQRKEPRYLIHGILYEGISALLYGRSERFKSTIALDMAIAVATGTDFLGHKTQQRPVIYIAGEGDGLWPRRLRAGLKARGFDGIAESVPLYTVPSPVQIHSPWDVEMLLKQIQQLGIEDIGLIIIDTLSVCFQGGKPNMDMAPFTSGVDHLRCATHASVLTIHHCGWDAKNPRGDSTLACNVGLQFRIDRENKREPYQLKLTCEKNRHGAHFEPLRFKAVPMELGHDEDNLPIAACVVQTVTASEPSECQDKLTPKHETLLRTLSDLLARDPTSKGIASGKWHTALLKANAADWRVKKTFYRYRDDLRSWGRIADIGGNGHGPFALTVSGPRGEIDVAA